MFSLQASKEDILLQIETAFQTTCEECSRDKPFALVVDGKVLELALQSDVKYQFLRLAVNCASVICCRVSPKQKALVGFHSYPCRMYQFYFIFRTSLFAQKI